jgi:tRNA 5-methylaminomethyl-2-thiouridine biosynthesis bifunctional protein
LGAGADVATLAREAGAWVARDAAGAELARASVAVLAAGIDLAGLAGAVPLPLQRVRGQLTGIAAGDCRAPRVVVSGGGYCLPPVDGVVWTGASYGPDDADTRVREAEQRGNLRHLAQLLPDNHFTCAGPACAGHVGFRAVAPDRMPLVGALPDVQAVTAQATRLAGAHLVDLPRQSGLYVAGGMA